MQEHRLARVECLAKQLQWEAKGIQRKNVGTVGILARILGEFARFSRVPKSANGTLETIWNAEVKRVVGCECEKGDMPKRKGTLINADWR